MMHLRCAPGRVDETDPDESRALVILEQVFGTLFVATLIARLAGIYPPKQESERR